MICKSLPNRGSATWEETIRKLSTCLLVSKWIKLNLKCNVIHLYLLKILQASSNQRCSARCAATAASLSTRSGTCRCPYRRRCARWNCTTASTCSPRKKYSTEMKSLWVVNFHFHFDTFVYYILLDVQFSFLLSLFVLQTCSKCQTRRKCTKTFSIQKFPQILVLRILSFQHFIIIILQKNCAFSYTFLWGT